MTSFMEIVKGKLYAVVTGDIVKSSKLPTAERERLPGLMQQASDDLREVFGEFVPAGVDIFRGDSWQMLVSDPVKSLRCGLFYRADLKGKLDEKKFDTRMSIGIGTIDMLPEDRVTLGSGQAFELSGKGLDAMKRKQRACLVMPERGPMVECLQTIVMLMDTIARGWTNQQAYAVAGAMRGLTHEQIAELDHNHTLTRATLTRHLIVAEWDIIESSLENWENTLKYVAQKRYNNIL